MRRNLMGMLSALSALAIGPLGGASVTLRPRGEPLDFGISALAPQPKSSKTGGRGTKSAQRKAQKERNKKKNRRKKK